MSSKQKQGQMVQQPVSRMSTQGQPVVTTVTATVSGPVCSNTMLSVMASASALLPTGSSTVVTTVSSAITSMAVAVQAENVPMPVCSDMGVNQLPGGNQGAEETIMPVPEDLVHGVTSAVGTPLVVATPSSAILYGQSSCGTTSSVTDAQTTITVTMLGHDLQTVSAGIQSSYLMARTNDSVVQSLLQHIQLHETSNAENVVLQQRIADLDTQAYQVQNLTAVYLKQEVKGSDIAVVTKAEHKVAKHKRKWSKKSMKKCHLVSFISSSSQSSAESNDSDSDGDTEALLSISSQSRQGAPKSG